MIDAPQEILVQAESAEPFEDRIDILFREMELAVKWQRPSVLLVVYSSEYVHADAEAALEDRLFDIRQTVHRLKIKGQNHADLSLLISEMGDPGNLIFFVDGLRWGKGKDGLNIYRALNIQREFFIENRIRIVFWLTEKEAVDLAHYAPDYWAIRHRVIEFVESPRPEQLSSHALETPCQGVGEFTTSLEDLDEKITLRTALLTDLPPGDESTAPRANLLLTLGVLYWRKGDFEKATEFLGAALDLVPKLQDDWFEALCLNAMALVDTDLERIDEAIRAYQRAAALAPEQIAPWNNLGKLQSRLGRHLEALESFQKAVERNPADAIGWNGLGDTCFQLGRPEEASAAYRKAIEITPAFASPWNGLGNVHAGAGELDQAAAAYRKAIEIDRRAAGAWIGLGSVFKAQGETEKAIAVFQMATRIQPRASQAWTELGHLYFETGTCDQAILAYRRVIELDHSSARSYSSLAALYVQQEQHAEALFLYQKALELVSDPGEQALLWNQVGDAYRRMNDYDNAIAAYRRADELDPETAESREQLPPAEADDELVPLPVEQDPGTPETVRQPGPVEQVLLAAGLEEQPEPAEEMNLAAGLEEQPEPAEETILAAGLEEQPEPTEEMNLAAELEEQPEPAGETVPAAGMVQPPLVRAEEQASPAAEVPLADEDEFAHWLESLGSAPFPPAGQNEAAVEVEANPPGTEAGPGSGQPDVPALETAQDETEAAPQPETVAETGLHQDDQVTKSHPGEDTRPVRPIQGEIDPRNANAWNELGNIYFNAGAEDEAINAFHKAIELDGDSGWPYSNLATIYAHKGRYAEAIPLYRKAIELLEEAKDKALLWNHLGDAYRRLNDPDKAAAAYSKATELDPSNANLLARARFSLLGNCRA